MAGVVTLALGILFEFTRPPSLANLAPLPLLPLFPLASEPESCSEYVDFAGDTWGDCLGYGTLSLAGGREYGEEALGREGLLLLDPRAVLARLPLLEADWGSGTSHCWLLLGAKISTIHVSRHTRLTWKGPPCVLDVPNPRF